MQDLKQGDLSSLTDFYNRRTGEVPHIQPLLHRQLRATFKKFQKYNSLVVSWLQLLDFQRDNVI